MSPSGRPGPASRLLPIPLLASLFVLAACPAPDDPRRHGGSLDLASDEPEPSDPFDLGLDLRRANKDQSSSDAAVVPDGMATTDAGFVFDKDASATPLCHDNGGACTSATECCGLLVCDDHVCKTPVTCRAEKQPCDVTKECCGGLACVENECRLVQAIDVLSRPCSEALPCVADGVTCYSLASAATGVCSIMCNDEGDCPDGSTCVASFCLKECPSGSGCESGSTCFSKYACWPDCRLQPGFCGSEQACGANGLCCQAVAAECDDVLTCCDGLSCVGGKCQDGGGCRQPGATCGYDNQCCEGNVCYQGMCQPPPACRPVGSDCVHPAECCGTTTCYSGKCSNYCGGGTGTAGTYCLDDNDCCNGYACKDAGTVTKCMLGPRVCHPDNDVCLSNGECCSGFCNPQLYCSPACGLLLDSCSASNPCCDDYICSGGKCQMPACKNVGESCGNGVYCCGTNVCTASGKCQAPAPTCGHSGASCSSSGQCCSGLACSAGHCQAPLSCGATGQSCASAGACCEGLACLDGQCAAPSGCTATGGGCSGSGECCSGLTCQAGTCQGGATCAAKGSSCASGQTCCAGLTCVAGTACGTVTSCSSGVFQYTSFLGSDPTLWARCDGGQGPKICKSGAWVTLNDDRCFCLQECSTPGTSCTSDGSGVCAKLEDGYPAMCINRSWGLCEL